MLQAMLNAHSEVCFLPDNQLFIECVLPESRQQRIASADATEILRVLTERTKVNRIKGIDMEALVRSLDSEPKSTFFLRLFLRTLSEYGRVQGKRIVGDKNPRHTGHVDTIKALVPNAVLIHIIRDLRDSVLSTIKTDWGRPLGFFRNVVYTKLEIGAMRGALLRSQGDCVIVRYEDLIRDPESVLSRLCHQLGLDFDPNMLRYAETAKAVVGDDELSWKGNVLKPVIPNNAGGWRTELVGWKLFVLEALLGTELEGYGYKLHYPRSPLTSGARWAFGLAFGLYALKAKASKGKPQPAAETKKG